MKNKQIVRAIAIVLALVMLLSVVWVVLETVTANARTQAETQAEINRLRTEKAGFEQRQREIQGRINTIEFERMSEIAKKRVLDERIMLTGEEIINITATIGYIELLIFEKGLEVEAALEREEEQLQLFRERVRNMEESGMISYLEILFDSTSFSDLLGRLDFVRDIMQADERIYFALMEARAETEAAEEALKATKDEHETERERLRDKEAELSVQVEEANALIRQIEANLEAERELHAYAVEEERRVQREINAAEAELRRMQEEERRRRAAEAANQVRGTGELIWPVPGHGEITSGFGIRRHPVFRDMRQHNGIDIGAPHGARVVAADSGTVIVATYSSGYGNYIVISHGDGRTTLYAHLSSMAVQRGDTVTKGDTIGRVGSTGISTGPHLHFEVSQNGSRINPTRIL